MGSQMSRGVFVHRDSDANETGLKTVHENVMQCTAHDREACSECRKSVQKFHAMLNAEVTLECGCKLVNPSVSHIKKLMPVGI